MQRGDAALQDLIAELGAIDAPYVVERFLSSGSYGAVCAGRHAVNQEPVAVKRVYTTVSDGRTVRILADSFLARRVVREVKLLCHFNHPNVLGLRDLIVQMQSNGNHKMYLVTELMKTDFHQIIGDRQLVLTRDHVQYYMYHMLLGLHVLHSAGVVHRDLHPGNMLLSEDNDVKICDFNLAREDTEAGDKTHYVTHRWYRAPELVMQHRHFTRKVDVWSAGCVMAELFNRKPLFRGTTYYNQLNKIVEIVGTPPQSEVEEFASPSAQSYLRNTLANCPPTPWQSVVPTAEPAALDLISRLLTFNPNHRITVEDALRHPFFSDLFDEDDLTEHLSGPFHFEDSAEVPVLQEQLMEEARRFEEVRRSSRASQGPLSPRSQRPGIDPGHTGMPRTASSVTLFD